jgi:hypothetical protein
VSVPGLHLERFAEDPTPQAVADAIAEQARRAARKPQTAILARQELARSPARLWSRSVASPALSPSCESRLTAPAR